MSKREKNIEIFEVENEVNGDIIVELRVKNESNIGKIMQDGKRFIAELRNGETFRAGTKAEAIEILLRDYHLHR